METDKELERIWEHLSIWGYDDFMGEMTALIDKQVVAANQDFAKYITDNLQLLGVKPSTLENAIYEALALYSVQNHVKAKEESNNV